MKALLVFAIVLASACLCLAAAPADGQVAVPGRGWVDPECVHQVPEGATITRQESGDFLVSHIEGAFKSYHVEALHERCPARVSEPASGAQSAQPYQGWNAYTADIQETTYTKFYANWNVPAAPVNPDSSSVLFFFTGLQNAGGNPTIDIIQPVLQFGDRSAAGGCLCWAIASWYVPTSGRSFVSPLKRVSTPSSIFGNMTQTGSQCWYISATDGSVVTPLSVCQPTLVSQPQAFVTEEAYAQSCADYPPSSTSLAFKNIKLWGASGSLVTPSWRTIYGTPNCNSVVTVNSPSQVTFSW